MFHFDSYLRELSARVDARLEKIVPSGGQAGPARLHEAMRHSLFGAGKGCARFYAWPLRKRSAENPIRD